MLVVRTILMVILGLYSQYWLLIHVSGFQSLLTALLCMLVCRAMFSVPYIHVNIFQVKTPELESTKKTHNNKLKIQNFHLTSLTS